MVNCAIFDIDGTIADLSDRRHFVEKKPKDWKSFFANIHNDKPIMPVITLMHGMLALNIPVVLCTGRGEDLRPATQAWLKKCYIDYDRMYMRTAGDHREDVIVKRELLAKIRADGYQPHLVVDDRDSVVAMWRSEGLVCLQAAPGNF